MNCVPSVYIADRDSLAADGCGAQSRSYAGLSAGHTGTALTATHIRRYATFMGLQGVLKQMNDDLITSHLIALQGTWLCKAVQLLKTWIF